MILLIQDTQYSNNYNNTIKLIDMIIKFYKYEKYYILYK